MKTKIILLCASATIFLMTSCALHRAWYKPGVSQADINRDLKECRDIATAPDTWSSAPYRQDEDADSEQIATTQIISESIAGERRVRGCMEGKGYARR